MSAEYVLAPSSAELLKHLGWSSSPRNVDLATAHIGNVTELIWSYTRGRGFTDDAPRQVATDLRAVIVSASARSVSNPSNAFKVVAGTVESTPGRFEGFTLAEQAVLNRYRVRVN